MVEISQNFVASLRIYELKKSVEMGSLILKIIVRTCKTSFAEMEKNGLDFTL